MKLNVDKGCIADVVDILKTNGFYLGTDVDILKYKEYEGTAEVDVARGVCRGKILFIKDLVTYESDSPTNLQQEFEAAVDDYLETCAALNREPAKPFRGQFNVWVPPEIHRAAALRAKEDEVSLNDIVVRALDAFLNSTTEINYHHLYLTLENDSGQLKALTSDPSKKLKWEKTHTH